MKHAGARNGGKIRAATAAVCAAGLIACADSALATDSPLEHAYVSPEALAEAAIEAVADQADSVLAALLIRESEYRDLLWPEMPDGEYTPFDFIWSQTLPPSRSARRNILREFEGVPLELVSVDLGPENKIERYASFTLYQDARMTVRRTDTGDEGIFPLMDALVEMGGGWKFMNFRDDS